jgi:hypothetical protein
VSVRVTAAAQFVTDEGISVTTAARVMQVSRQAVSGRQAPATEAQAEPVEPVLRLVPPVLPEDWQTMALGPDACDVETAIHVLALRHPSAGYRKITARARRFGYVFTRKKTARLLKAWGSQAAEADVPHPARRSHLHQRVRQLQSCP